jgi:hypothetical protein
MKKINTLALMTCAAMTFGVLTSAPVFAADDKMMMKNDGMAMEKSDAMMEKSDSIEKMEMSQEAAFTSETFSEAQASGKPFFVAFHKKGCPMCAEQKQALKAIYADPDYKDLKVLVVDYLNDTASLKKFNVGMQGALILYKGENEISRSSGLVKSADIAKQIQG